MNEEENLNTGENKNVDVKIVCTYPDEKQGLTYNNIFQQEKNF